MDNTCFSIIDVLSFQEDVANEEQNRDFIIDSRRPKRRRSARAGTPCRTEASLSLQLALKLDPSSMKDATRGYYFGSNPNACDVVLAKNTDSGVSGIHFRVCLDYTRLLPDRLEIINISQHGIEIDGSEVRGQTPYVLRAGSKCAITAGRVSLELFFCDQPLSDRAWSDLRSFQTGPPALTTLALPRSRRATPRVSRNVIYARSTPTILNSGRTYEVHPPTIGKGFSGPVKKATRTTDLLTVAIKTCNESEINIMMNLKHRFIVNLIDYAIAEDDNSKARVATEYAPFGTLDEYLAGGTLDEENARTVARQVLEATQFLHERNVIHRDITPMNTFVFARAPGLYCKLGDFGLAKEVSLGSMPSEAVGTPAYAAPEVFNGKQYDHKVDIYSCGVLIFRLLTGDERASQDTYDGLWTLAGDTLAQKLRQREFSTDCLKLLSSMLQKHPSDRPDAASCLKHSWLRPSVMLSETVTTSIERVHASPDKIDKTSPWRDSGEPCEPAREDLPSPTEVQTPNSPELDVPISMNDCTAASSFSSLDVSQYIRSVPLNVDRMGSETQITPDEENAAETAFETALTAATLRSLIGMSPSPTESICPAV